MKKNRLILLLGLFPCLLSLNGCGVDDKIGILQFGDVPALDDAREGFKQALKDGGFGNKEIDFQSAHFSAVESATLAQTMISKHKLNLGIATPCATALKAEAENTGKTNPILFTAVTDPVGAGLVSNAAAPEGFVTGSSDLQPESALEAQVKLLKAVIPTATKLGILYTSSETNSKVQADKAQAIAEKDGLTVSRRTCSGVEDLSSTVAALVSDKVDAIWVPTDNNVAGNIGKVEEAIGENKILVIAGEEGMLTNAHVSVSISYFALGKRTGDLACQILNGKDVKDLPVFYPTIDDCSYVYSKSCLEKSGFSVSDLPSTYTWVNVD